MISPSPTIRAGTPAKTGGVVAAETPQGVETKTAAKGSVFLKGVHEKMGALSSILFPQDEIQKQVLKDEATAVLEQHRLKLLVWWQAVSLLALAVLFLVAAPILQPIYRFQAVRPDHASMNLLPLFVPNMTNEAILSWTTESVTALMTVGFGNFDRQILDQRPLFTDEGWESFLTALWADDMRGNFKQHQLVLTTVPRDVPVIVAQGMDLKKVYFWKVQLPVIMTYATNNNETRKQKGVVQLTIVRVPPSENVRGIAIKAWKMV